MTALRFEAMIRRQFKVLGTSGDEFLCRCPWHRDLGRPNLYVNGAVGLYLCHSCGAKGALLKKGEQMPGISTDNVRSRLSVMREPAEAAMQYKPESWLEQFKFPHEGWADRGLSEGTIKRFDLGYDPFHNCLTIPLRTATGDLMGVIQRRLGDEKPKYLYPKGYKIGRYLFGSWVLAPEQKTVALVEGSIDAMACWDARVPALGLLGARLSVDQRLSLQKQGIRKAVIMTDNDSAGKAAVLQVKESLEGSGIAVYVGRYRPYWNCKDPAELNPDRRRKMYHSATPFWEWVNSTMTG